MKNKKIVAIVVLAVMAFAVVTASAAYAFNLGERDCHEDEACPIDDCDGVCAANNCDGEGCLTGDCHEDGECLSGCRCNEGANAIEDRCDGACHGYGRQGRHGGC